MSDYSQTLGETLEMWTLNDHYDLKSKIEAGRKVLFDFPYPFFDETKRKEFETRFIRNFYFREIGFDVEARFKFELENWLNLRMPYYNRLFESELLQYDPLENVNTQLDHNKKNQKDQKDSRNTDSTSQTDGQSHSTNESKLAETSSGKRDGTNENEQNGFKRDLSSDTPDSRLAITTNDGSGVIEYASKIDEETDKNKQTGKQNETSSGKRDSSSDSESDMSASSKGVSNTKDAYQSDVDQNEDFKGNQKGKTGSMTYSQMITEHRGTFLQIERDLFKEMNQLFMLIY